MLTAVRRSLRKGRHRLHVLREFAEAQRRPGSRGSLAKFASLMPTGSNRTVVVIADPTQRTQVVSWLDSFPTDRRHVVSSETAPEWQRVDGAVTHHRATTLGEMSRAIRVIGPVDVLVDVLSDELLPEGAENHFTVWRRLFFHVKPRGVYLIDRSSAARKSIGTASDSWLQLLAAAQDPDTDQPAPTRNRELIAATDDIVITRDLVITSKRLKHYVRLTDAETNHTLPVREPSITVTDLRTVPAGELVSSASAISHESAAPVDLPAQMTYPALHLRKYTGRIAFAGSTLFYTDYTILPDSFRHHLADTATNPQVKRISPSFARIPAEAKPTETLEGEYYNLDCAYSGHFGHIMTEVISRLWGWDRAKEETPELKGIMRLRRRDQREPVLERRLFAAYGIAEDDIVTVDRPVYLESVTSATPMWHNNEPYYVHPDLAAVWRRLGAALVDRDAVTHDRIFVSRGGHLGHRACRNALEVERFFADRGFAIVHPERLDLGHQAAVFANASVIAGFGGSAMFNLMFAENVKTVILLSHEAYTARNEHLFTSLIGADVHYFWSPPDVPHPDEAWSQEAFYSAWEFDFARNRGPLENAIDTL